MASGCATLSAPKEQILADVNGKPIAEKDLIASLNPKERGAYLAFKKQKVDRMIAQSLLEQEAERRRLSLQDLLSVEIFSKSVVTHDEIHRFYDQNKKAYQKKKHEAWEKEISEFLQNQKQQYWTKKLLAAITQRSDVKYYLPEVPPASEKETQKPK